MPLQTPLEEWCWLVRSSQAWTSSQESEDTFNDTSSVVQRIRPCSYTANTSRHLTTRKSKPPSNIQRYNLSELKGCQPKHAPLNSTSAQTHTCYFSWTSRCLLSNIIQDLKQRTYIFHHFAPEQTHLCFRSLRSSLSKFGVGWIDCKRNSHVDNKEMHVHSGCLRRSRCKPLFYLCRQRRPKSKKWKHSSSQFVAVHCKSNSPAQKETE